MAVDKRTRWCQELLNRFFNSRGLTYAPLGLDGELGPHTQRNIRHARYYLGLGGSLEGQPSEITDELIRTLKDPRRRLTGWSVGRNLRRLRVAGQRQRTRKREVKAAQKHGGGTGAQAVAFLVARAGWHESPSGSNDAPFLKNWRDALHMGWMRGQPWCGFGIEAAYHYGAHKDLPADTASTIAIANRARSGNGYSQVGSNSIRVGDLVVFNFGSGAPKHVGLARGPMSGGVIPTVECNTSSANGGSQSNGGGIYIRTRSIGLVHTIARPK